MKFRFTLPFTVILIASHLCFSQQNFNDQEVESKTGKRALQKVLETESLKKISPNENENSSVATSFTVRLNLQVRENDPFKSNIVAKYFSAAKLKQMNERNVDNIKFIDFYFNKSLEFEIIENTVADQEKVNAFIYSFDPFTVEKQRKETEVNILVFEDSGVRILLLPQNAMPVEVRKYISNMQNSAGSGGRAIPVQQSMEK